MPFAYANKRRGRLLATTTRLFDTRLTEIGKRKQLSSREPGRRADFQATKSHAPQERFRGHQIVEQEVVLRGLARASGQNQRLRCNDQL